MSTHANSPAVCHSEFRNPKSEIGTIRDRLVHEFHELHEFDEWAFGLRPDASGLKSAILLCEAADRGVAGRMPMRRGIVSLRGPRRDAGRPCLFDLPSPPHPRPPGRQTAKGIVRSPQTIHSSG